MSIDLKSIIAKGEGINIEFKESKNKIPSDVYETVCSFSNRIGGHIFLGVSDDGEITGVEPSCIAQMKKNFVTTINNPKKFMPTVYTTITEYWIEDKPILYIPVSNSSQVHRLDGRFFDRNEDSDIDISNSTMLVAEMFARKGNIQTELRVFSQIKLDDIDPEQFERVRNMARMKVGEETHLWDTLSNFDLLKSAKLIGIDEATGKEGLNLAGVLLLGSEQLIASVLSHHRTDALLRVDNIDRYDDRDDIRVNLIDSYYRLMAFIAKHLRDPFYLEDTQRVSIRNKVFREVCSNLLIHREFSNPIPAKLIIERGQVRTENANRPHGYGEIDPNNFSPFSKNPIIAKFFSEIGLADELGSGFKRLMHYVPLYSGDKPELIEKDIFTTIIPIPDFKPIEVPAPQDTPTDTHTVTPTDTHTVTPTDKNDFILSYCMIPRSRAEIQSELGLKDKMHFINTYLTPLIKSNRLLMTIPDKPTSRNQKYVTKTEEA